MRVSYRLYAAVAPSVLGVLLVAALSYWGQYQRAAPTAVVVVAAIAAVASLAVAWHNTRYVIRRVEALAARDGTTAADEIESIGRRLTSLDTEAARARADASRVAADAQHRATEYAALIADVTATAQRRVEETRMPVHILLNNTQFGELNENQEEMLGAAESALTALDEDLAKLRALADIDRGALTVTRESVHVGDMLRSLQPMLVALAEREGVRLALDVEPALPRVMADASRLSDALRLALTDDIRYAVPGSTVRVDARSSPEAVTVAIEHGSHHSYAGNILLAARLLAAQGGTLEHADGRTVIVMPRGQSTGSDGARRVANASPPIHSERMQS